MAITPITEVITQLDVVQEYSEDYFINISQRNNALVNTVFPEQNTLAEQMNTLAGEINTIGETVVAKEALIAPHYDAIDNAATNATSAQLSKWVAEAEAMTADSYASEPKDVFVKEYTSNGDGTFTSTSTTKYSALHWSETLDGTNLVHKTGNETISGVKTFESPILIMPPNANMANLFGRIWNITSDVYKRIGLNLYNFSPATQNEFTTWLSPTADRVNAFDVATPSDLTTELDTNPNLPFSYIARKVVDNTGAVSTFDHATPPTSTQQIMSEIPKCYYIDALIVSDAKEYDVKLVSKTPFSVDAIADLGFASITSITCFNPTAGISSGTVVGNVISSALHPAFVWATGAEADFTYVGSFHSVTGRSTFGTGVKPTASITIATARTQHTGFGTNFNQHDFWNNSLIQLLAYIERGSNYLEQSGTKWDGNSSSYDGSQTSYDQDNGKTLGLQNRTGTIIGSVTDIGKVIANSYRGIENYHSALWMWIDGININGGICYLAKAGSTFVSDIATAPYFASGYTATATASWQSINKWQAGTFIPHATAGGTTTTKVSDQMYGNTGWRVLLFGGYLSYAGISGLSCWNGNNASSNLNWNIVSRAIFCQTNNIILLVSLALAKTHYYLSRWISSQVAKLQRGQKL